MLKFTGVIAVVAICIGAVLLAAVWTGNLFAWLLLSVMTILLASGQIMFVRRRSILGAAAVIDKLLATGHCAACGYDLNNLPIAHDDGCVVCPECGAAWRL